MYVAPQVWIPECNERPQYIGLLSTLQRSTSRKWPTFKPEFMIPGRMIDLFYWIVNGIYLRWRVFMKTVLTLRMVKEKVYSKAQDSFRKGVERFYVVQQVAYTGCTISHLVFR